MSDWAIQLELGLEQSFNTAAMNLYVVKYSGGFGFISLKIANPAAHSERMNEFQSLMMFVT